MIYDSFLGHSIEYWIKLESFAKENMYDKLIEKVCKLEAEVKRLQNELNLEIAHGLQAEAEVKRLQEGIRDIMESIGESNFDDFAWFKLKQLIKEGR